VPTFREAGHELVAGTMRGLAGPAGLPAAKAERLALAVRRVAENPEFQALAAQQMLPLRFLGPAEWSAELVAQRSRYLAMWNEQPWRD
jgi:tripartite-type tricarboxylate transporter receptor subunit TctC